MFGMFRLPSPEEEAREREWQAREVARRLPLCVPWDPQIKFAKELNIKAETFPFWRHFPDVVSTRETLPYRILVENPSNFRMSDDGTFFYCVKELPKGVAYETYYGNKRGTVMFDGPVLVPTLYRKKDYTDRYGEMPWMSIMPMEMLSLRGGTRLAKGHTVVAGLGLGYQLVEVTRRERVTKVTLVEINQGLVNLIMPALQDWLGPAPVEVIVGDAQVIVPTITADVALIDIFASYGGNEFVACPHIPRVWCWGSQHVNGNNSLFGW
jgi:hypothetical protein